MWADDSGGSECNILPRIRQATTWASGGNFSITSECRGDIAELTMMGGNDDHDEVGEVRSSVSGGGDSLVMSVNVSWRGVGDEGTALRRAMSNRVCWPWLGRGSKVVNTGSHRTHTARRDDEDGPGWVHFMNHMFEEMGKSNVPVCASKKVITERERERERERGHNACPVQYPICVDESHPDTPNEQA